MAESEHSHDRDPIRVLIVADVCLYRDGLTACLRTRAGVVVVGTAAERAEALKRIDELAPQVVVVDAATRDALELMRDVRRGGSLTKTIAVAVEDESDFSDFDEAGASGYMAVDASVEDLVATIERAARSVGSASPPGVPHTSARRDQQPRHHIVREDAETTSSDTLGHARQSEDTSDGCASGRAPG